MSNFRWASRLNYVGAIALGLSTSACTGFAQSTAIKGVPTDCGPQGGQYKTCFRIVVTEKTAGSGIFQIEQQQNVDTSTPTTTKTINVESKKQKFLWWFIDEKSTTGLASVRNCKFIGDFRSANVLDHPWRITSEHYDNDQSAGDAFPDSPPKKLFTHDKVADTKLRISVNNYQTREPPDKFEYAIRVQCEFSGVATEIKFDPEIINEV